MKERKTKQGKRHFQKVYFLPKSPYLGCGRMGTMERFREDISFCNIVLDTELIDGGLKTQLQVSLAEAR